MPALLRMVDANANRAREALRVMEDIARFVLDSAELSEILKHLRHDLRSALAPFDQSLLLAARDSQHDVGREVKTPAEFSRRTARDVAAAAASRLSEALRSLEEATKVLALTTPGADARAVERIRYRAYDIEKRLLLVLPTGLARQWRLCLLLTESLCMRAWLEVARAALDAGTDCIQLREKSLDDRELLRRAETLRALVDGRADLVINDRPDIALLAGAHGVHLGQTDLPCQKVRSLIGGGLVIGCSTSSLAEARAAVEAGADYCGVGPMFPTTTKDKPHLAGTAYLREYLASVPSTPHLAIGGINPGNIRELREAGCRGVAVSSAVCASPDPAGVCQEILRAFA